MTAATYLAPLDWYDLAAVVLVGCVVGLFAAFCSWLVFGGVDRASTWWAERHLRRAEFKFVAAAWTLGLAVAAHSRDRGTVYTRHVDPSPVPRRAR